MISYTIFLYVSFTKVISNWYRRLLYWFIVKFYLSICINVIKTSEIQLRARKPHARNRKTLKYTVFLEIVKVVKLVDAVNLIKITNGFIVSC